MSDAGATIADGSAPTPVAPLDAALRDAAAPDADKPSLSDASSYDARAAWVPAEAPCASIHQRREFRALPRTEWMRFVDTLNAMRFRSEGIAHSLYDWFAMGSLGSYVSAVDTPFLLPVNRLFMRDFELEVRMRGAPDFDLPYWDVSLDSAAPALSPLFTADYMGGDGEAGSLVVVDGPFAHWVVSWPEMHELQRQFGAPNLPDTQSIEHLLNAASYDVFRLELESVVLKPIHAWVGGDMRDFTMAFNDPLFWLMASYADRLWAAWQDRHPDLADTLNGLDIRDDPRSYMEYDIYAISLVGSHWYTHKAADVMHTEQLCYAY